MLDCHFLEHLLVLQLLLVLFALLLLFRRNDSRALLEALVAIVGVLGIVNGIILEIEVLHVHLEERDEHLLGVLGDLHPDDSVVLVQELVGESDMEEVRSGVVDGHLIEVVEEVFEQHPEPPIIFLRVLLSPFFLPQHLVDEGVLFPSLGVVRPWSQPFSLAPWVSQLHEVSHLVATFLGGDSHTLEN